MVDPTAPFTFNVAFPFLYPPEAEEASRLVQRSASTATTVRHRGSISSFLWCITVPAVGTPFAAQGKGTGQHDDPVQVIVRLLAALGF